jgi:hypothetical protein
MTPPTVPVDYEPALVEEAVFRCVAGGVRTAAAYHAAREEAYAVADPEAREAAFRRLHSDWFTRLDLGAPLSRALAELPVLAEHVDRCIVRWARSPSEEGADLLVNAAAPNRSPGRPSGGVIVVGLRPDLMRERGPLLHFLRHELLHVADMLDPSFGYESALPPAEGGPTHDRLLMERYRALWAATIDGRLVRRGQAPEGARERRRRDFVRTFGVPGAVAGRLLRRFFDGQPHTHAELVAAARDPARAAGSTGAPRCPVCGFCSPATASVAASLSPAVAARVQADFPRWRPQDGLCAQCAELYRARELSRAALQALPRA